MLSPGSQETTAPEAARQGRVPIDALLTPRRRVVVTGTPARRPPHDLREVA